MAHHAPADHAHIWRARPHEAEVAALLVAFRNHDGRDWPSDNAFLAGVERLIEDPSTEYLLGAREAGAPPAGVAQLRFRWSVWRAAEECLLEDLFVSPGARGAGIGRALLDAAIDRARERGCRRIALHTAEGNEAAVGLYRSAGFSDRGHDGTRALVLRLSLR
jgi:ribosomal protein S18 acetylase RimI-like enzyme